MSNTALEIRPHVEVINGTLRTSSFKIAEHFGKNHKDVLRSIRGLECSAEFRERNFAPTQFPLPIHNGGHRQIPAYSITRDGFTFLAMGFTGKEAAKWKEAYIDAFNTMERELTKSAPDVMKSYRWMVSRDHEQRHHIQAIENDAMVATVPQWIESIRSADGLWLTDKELIDIIDAASSRLRARKFPAPN